MILKKISSFAAIVFFISAAGCGYTTKTTLPQNIKTIYVKTTINDVPITALYAYQPGLEIAITNGMIRRFHQDGNLKVVEEKDADAILESKLITFDQEGLRFSRLENVQEYRLYVVIAFRLLDAKTGNVIMEEGGFAGQADYFVTDVRSLGRDEASRRAVDDLAKNVVDRITEDW